MTNEIYLYVSYFAAVVLGLVLAAATVVALRKPLMEATGADKVKKLGLLVRRVFSFWVFVAVLLAFISVSYIDCSHETYAKVVADRDHLIDKTQQHVSRISIALAVALFTYCIGLVFFLWSSARSKLRLSPGHSR
jgi:hypothetical protein